MKAIQQFLIPGLVLFHCLAAWSQGTSINTTGAAPHTSAMLDVQSTTRGVLVPRLTTVQRQNIATPATGLLVYDTNTRSFWYRLPASWIELTDNFHGLQDADHDTKVQVEESPDEDMIRFDIGGVEGMVLRESTQGATRLEIGPDIGLIVGRYAGETSVSGWNTLIGYEAGRFNTTGDRNVFLGYRAGYNNGAGIDRNVLIGYESGVNNNGSFNTLVGYHAGTVNSTGYHNTFTGYDAGVQNTTGYRNTFIGSGSGHNNETTFENTMVGFNAGYNNVASLNTYLGKNAGLANRTGQYNVVAGADAAGNSLSNRNLANGNAILGYQAGYWANGMGENALVGYRAGYNLTTGSNNVLMGHESGFALTSGISNVAIGIDALHANVTGHRSVAIGDSTLYITTVGGNVAVGSKAGMDNTTGVRNTFLGPLSGTDNTTGNDNVTVGASAGRYNKTGMNNVFVGSNAASSNDDGKSNLMVGFYAGWRNSSGSNNIFMGELSADNNIDGTSNIAIGTKALSKNSDGNFNIAIGDHALGYLPNNGYPIARNIAIGMNVGFDASGNDNILIGNGASTAIAGTQNVVIGNDAGDEIGSGSNNVMIGRNSNGGGINNTLIGAETSANWIFAPEAATAIGYNASCQQDFSVILGDASNYSTKVGIGTITPESWLHIEGQGFDAFRVSQNGSDALRVLTNSTVVVNEKLLVNTLTGKPGFEMSVNGSIACEELVVQNSVDWPDYVFAEQYPLMSLGELRSFIDANKHLPGIPSAAEVADEGVRVGEMQKRLLEKIEELTLHVIALESRLATIENK